MVILRRGNLKSGERFVAKNRILLVEDDPGGRELGLFNLKKAGYHVDAAVNGSEGLELFAHHHYDCVITDLKMPGVSGMDVLHEVRKQDPQIPVIVVTAYGNVERAVEAMKLGASDFIGKPFNREHLLLSVEKALDNRAMRKELRELRIQASGVERPFLFASGAMKKLADMADRVATSEATVLITGESGTGKELLARRLHARGSRAHGPFIAVNCAAVPAELLESELFGHKKGAFTGATKDRQGRFRQARNGTLFLDEIAELPMKMQGKLLRVLQERVVDVLGTDEPVSVDVRVIAATNKNLEERIKDGLFREDLYFRLNVVELSIPPLRDRLDDLKLLAKHFVEKHSRGREIEIPDELFGVLRGHSWPGNARELENICERLTILAQDTLLSIDDLPPTLKKPTKIGKISPSNRERKPNPIDPHSSEGWPPLPPDGLSLVELEQQVIERVLELKHWNIAQAARYLRVPRHILTYRMEKFGIRRPQN